MADCAAAGRRNVSTGKAAISKILSAFALRKQFSSLLICFSTLRGFILNKNVWYRLSVLNWRRGGRRIWFGFVLKSKNWVFFLQGLFSFTVTLSVQECFIAAAAALTFVLLPDKAVSPTRRLKAQMEKVAATWRSRSTTGWQAERPDGRGNRI